MVGLTVTSSKRAYAIPRSTAPEPLPLQQSITDPYLCRRHSNTVLAQSLWGLWVLMHTRFVRALQATEQQISCFPHLALLALGMFPKFIP